MSKTNERSWFPLLLAIGAALLLLHSCANAGPNLAGTTNLGRHNDAAELAAPGPTIPDHSHGPCEMVAELDSGMATAGPGVGDRLRAECDRTTSTTSTPEVPNTTEAPDPSAPPEPTTTTDYNAVV